MLRTSYIIYHKKSYRAWFHRKIESRLLTQLFVVAVAGVAVDEELVDTYGFSLSSQVAPFEYWFLCSDHSSSGPSVMGARSMKRVSSEWTVSQRIKLQVPSPKFQCAVCMSAWISLLGSGALRGSVGRRHVP